MSVVLPFKGLRPPKQLAEQVASPPYDVLNREEAIAMAAGNPISFLHINKPEIDVADNIESHDDRVYQRGADNLKKFRQQGTLQQDATECFYVYKQIMGDHEQVGLVAAASVEEYEQDLIKKHEFTRPDKENDRVNHMQFLNAQVGPVFLTYQASENIDALIDTITAKDSEYDFTSADSIRHVFWLVDDSQTITALKAMFGTVPCLYVADGHHRSAAAMRVKQKMQRENTSHTGAEPYNYFLTVIFPHNQMKILDYNRVVKDLNGLSTQEFLAKVEQKFTISPQDQSAKPETGHVFGLYCDKQWYRLEAKPNIWNEDNPVQRLDVSILQENILSPILGIENPRTDKRIDFVGGIRGMAELEKRVDSGEWQVAFALFPTSIENLMAIADAGEVMPPKSTWFEPKLKSGLVVHCLE